MGKKMIIGRHLLMEETEKERIVVALEGYCARKGSANKAAISMGISSATISKMIGNDWALISDEMFRKVAAKMIEFNSSEGWQVVPTKVSRLLGDLLEDARSNSLVFAVVSPAGSGKSQTLRNYTQKQKSVYLLSCNEFWNKKTFLQELLTAMGRASSGTVNEMMKEAVQALQKDRHPLIIMDEADKLSDPVLYFFITLYNLLEDQCGILLCATSYLDTRLQRGIKLRKKGYNEIYSRCGRKCIDLAGVTHEDIVTICKANGITQDQRVVVEVRGKEKQMHTLEYIVQESEADLRRVKRLVFANR